MTWTRIARDALVLLGIIAAVVFWLIYTQTGGDPVDVRYYWAANPSNLYPHPELGEHNGYNYSPAFEFVVGWWRWLPFDIFVAIWRAILLGALVYLAVGLIAGVDIKSGVGGAVLLVVYAVFIAIAFAGIGATMGARTGSPEAVQGVFPLIFSLFFLSSMSMPRDLIAIDWFRTVATWNPVSYLIEGLRSLVITGWDGTALWRGAAVGVAILILSFWAADRALATRMART
jgi:ABC-type Na+ efflux pump permease subunit